MKLTDADYQRDALEIVAKAKEERHQSDFGYRGDLPIGETWAWTIARSRDSDQLEESNFDTISNDMMNRFPGDVQIERFSHWAVGWTERLAVKMLDKKKKVTKAGKGIIDWRRKLESYPVADEEEFSKREFEQTLENIQNEASISEEEASLVYRWLSRNKPGALDEHYASKKDILEALDAEGIERFSLLRRKNRERDDKTREFKHDQLALVKDVVVRREGEFCAVTVFTGYKEAFPYGHTLTLDDDLPCDFDFKIDNLLHLTPDEAMEYLNWQLRDRKRELEGEAEEQRQRTEYKG